MMSPFSTAAPGSDLDLASTIVQLVHSTTSYSDLVNYSGGAGYLLWFAASHGARRGYARITVDGVVKITDMPINYTLDTGVRCAIIRFNSSIRVEVKNSGAGNVYFDAAYLKV